MYLPIHYSKRQQSGIALIVVLLFLILITIAGAIAVRQSVVDLNVATSDQVGTLILNSSDSVLAHIEQVSNTPYELNNNGKPDRSKSNPAYETMLSQNNGILGYFITDGQSRINQQFSFCYRPNEAQLFNASTAGKWLPGNPTMQPGSNSSCAPNSRADYTSARNIAMTQVSVKSIENILSDNFEDVVEGESVEVTRQSYVPQLLINSVSVLPSMSSVTANQITACLGRPSGNIADYGFNPATAGLQGQNLNDCLKQNGIPANSVVIEGVVKDDSEGGFDVTTGQITSVR